MAAAGIGNLISDVVGVSMGEVIESFCATRLGLRAPALTEAQLDLRVVRTLKAGSCMLGVAVGCVIGMAPLLWMDNKKAVYFSDDEAHLYRDPRGTRSLPVSKNQLNVIQWKRLLLSPKKAMRRLRSRHRASANETSPTASWAFATAAAASWAPATAATAAKSVRRLIRLIVFALGRRPRGVKNRRSKNWEDGQLYQSGRTSVVRVVVRDR